MTRWRGFNLLEKMVLMKVLRRWFGWQAKHSLPGVLSPPAEVFRTSLHELRKRQEWLIKAPHFLKVDSTGAARGRRNFIAAVAAVKNVVGDQGSNPPAPLHLGGADVIPTISSVRSLNVLLMFPCQYGTQIPRATRKRTGR